MDLVACSPVIALHNIRLLLTENIYISVLQSSIRSQYTRSACIVDESRWSLHIVQASERVTERAQLTD